MIEEIVGYRQCPFSGKRRVPLGWGTAADVPTHGRAWLSSELIQWLRARTVVMRPWVRCVFARRARNQAAGLGGRQLVHLQARSRERDLRTPVCVISLLFSYGLKFGR